MEFYPQKQGEYREHSRFNSQRDGILLCIQIYLNATSWVSIPNGMEFYNSDLHIETEFSLFQFPMGWNSTLQGIGDDFKIVGFNSQRDGILLCKA